MNDIIVTVGSVTYAIKLRRLLMRGGVRSKLVKVDKSNTSNGCTHGVELKNEDYFKAVLIMRKKGVIYSIYQPRGK